VASDGGASVVAAKIHPAQPHLPSFDGGAIEFVAQTFEDLYPVFLIRRSMPRGDKAGLWRKRYLGRWVRWSGTVQSRTQNGLTLRTLSTTTTFDVSLHLDASSAAALAGVRRGSRVTYIGRLDDFDDIFRQFHLTNGTLIEVLPAAAPSPHDAGAP
jgi:hypothetical protein